MGDTMINGNETFSAPYAGSDALSSIDFSKAQITNTIGTGDFDQASLNSSGHQNVFAHAESYEYGLGKYYEEDPDNWAHWDKYRIRHDIVNAIKQMPTDKAWEYITGLGEEDEDPELDEEYALHEKNKDLDAALKNLIIERDFIQEPQGTGILNELSAKNYYKNAEFIELTDDMVLDICVMAHEDGHGVYEVYPVDLVRQAMQRINENPSLMERFHKKIGPMSMGAEVDTSPDRLPGESKEEMKKRRDTPEYKAARKERQKKKREDVQKTAPYLKVKDYEKHTTGKSYVLDLGLPSKVLLHMEDLENSGMKIDEIDTIQVHSQEGGRFPAIIDSRFKGKAAETFAAASTARPDLIHLLVGLLVVGALTLTVLRLRVLTSSTPFGFGNEHPVFTLLWEPTEDWDKTPVFLTSVRPVIFNRLLIWLRKNYNLSGKIDQKAFGWQLRNEGAFGVQRHPFQQYLR